MVQNFLVLIPNIFAIEPGKIVFLGPLVKYIGTWISEGNVGLSETRNAPNWNVSGTRDFLPHCAVFQSNKRNRAPGHDYPFVFENSLEFQFAPIVAVQHRWNSTLNLDPVQRHHHVFAFQPLP